MPLYAFLLILLSAFMHASWNLMSKARRPSMVFYMQASLTAALLWLTPVIIGINRVDWQNVPTVFYYLAAGSVFCEVIYFIGLANAYKRADISVAYPMVRALPVLFTAILALIFQLGKPLTPMSLVGMLCIFAGCFIMPQKKFSDLKLSAYLSWQFAFIVLGALGTTGYTIFDSMALNRLKDYFAASDKVLISCMYLGILEAAIAFSLFCIIPFIKTERYEFKHSFCRTWVPSLASLFSSSAYGIILLAMPMVTNVSLVQAFRQISLPICAIAGVILLHEKMTLPRTIGLILIVSGLIMSIF